MKKNEIGLQGIKTLEDCLSLSKTIKELNISGNNIGDEGLEIVIRALSNKKRQSLTILSLSSNKITSKGCKMICDFILKGNNLEELHLSNWDLILGKHDVINIKYSNGLKGSIGRGGNTKKYFYYHSQKGIVYCEYDKIDCIYKLYQHLTNQI